jgi:predicted neuraminidase
MKIIKLLSVLLFSVQLNLSAQIRNSSHAIVREEYIFPFQNEHVHGSSITILPNGDKLAVWFQGSGERTADDVRIMGARQKKGNSSWTKPFLMADTKGIPDCNPVLFLNRKGKLFLFWIAVMANEWEDAIIRYRTSTNYAGDGAPVWEWQDNILFKPDTSFEKEVERKFKQMPETQEGWSGYAPKYDKMITEASKDLLKRSLGWMTRIPPVTLESGRILLPLYSDGFNFSIVAISDDDGTTWRPSLPIVARGPIQPALALKKNGEIIAYMRDSGDAPGRVWISSSKDNGESWSLPHKTEIPNEASVELFAMKNGTWVYLGNDINNGRHQLSVYLSNDEGATWKWKDQIEYDNTRRGGFSYPCIFEDSDGMLHFTYSYSTGLPNEKTIKHVVFDPAKLQGK